MKKVLKVWLILLAFGAFINVRAVDIDDNNDNGNLVPPPPVSTGIVKNIKINDKIVLCDAKEHVCEYITEDNAINKVVIEYETNDGATGKNEKEITKGYNEFKLTITAKSGESEEYTFKVTKNVKSTDSSLKKLSINGQEIALKSGQNKYSTTVSFSTSKLEVEAIPNDSNAKVDGANKNKLYFDLFESSKEISVKVIAESEDVTTYVITVSKREEADTTLKTLTIKDATIDFESNVYDYELSVLKSVDKLEIEALPTDTSAKVTINNKTLEMGENTITIDVENDGNKKTYTLKVTRLDMEDESVANLKSLKIKNYDLNFKENKYEYDLVIGDDNFLDIDYETINPDAKVNVTGNLDLVNGSIIKIKVSYNDEITNIYRINIIKEELAEKDSNLSKIIIIITIIILVIIAIVLLIIILKRRNKNNSNPKKLKKEKTSENENIEKIGVNPSDIVNIDDDTGEIEEVI